MSKETVYVSGPITGVDNYLEIFHEASKKLAAQGYIPIDPCTLPHNHGKSHGEYRKEAIRALLDCDYIFMLPGWRQCNDAMCERAVAEACGIKLLEN